MSNANQTKVNETAPNAVPSSEPLEHEPTPKPAREEKKNQEEQAAEIAKPKPSGAV